MSENTKILKKCSKCKSTKVQEKYFSKNLKDEFYKTCDKCRIPRQREEQHRVIFGHI